MWSTTWLVGSHSLVTVLALKLFYVYWTRLHFVLMLARLPYLSISFIYYKYFSLINESELFNVLALA